MRPPLGGQTADVYIPLSQLQVLASQKGSVNVLLVRAENGASVGDVQKQIETLYPRAEVASAKEVADSISGSLVDAASLSKRLGTALAILAAMAAFLLAVLLTLASVGKRVRELGTLKALGWTQWLVVRQVVGESLAQGVLGGLVGVVLGIASRRDRGVRADADRELEHRRRRRLLRARQVTARSVSDQVALSAPIAAAYCCRLRPRRRRRPGRRRCRCLPRLAPSARRRPEAGMMEGAVLYDVQGAKRFFQRGQRSSRRSVGSTSGSTRASSSRSRGRAARGRRRCCSCWAPSTGRALAAFSSRDAISPRSATASSPISG